MDIVYFLLISGYVVRTTLLYFVKVQLVALWPWEGKSTTWDQCVCVVMCVSCECVCVCVHALVGGCAIVNVNGNGCLTLCVHDNVCVCVCVSRDVFLFRECAGRAVLLGRMVRLTWRGTWRGSPRRTGMHYESCSFLSGGTSYWANPLVT